MAAFDKHATVSHPERGSRVAQDPALSTSTKIMPSLSLGKASSHESFFANPEFVWLLFLMTRANVPQGNTSVRYKLRYGANEVQLLEAAHAKILREKRDEVWKRPCVFKIVTYCIGSDKSAAKQYRIADNN